MPTSKSPAASQVYAVETCSRSAGSAAQSPKNATSAPPNATNVVERRDPACGASRDPPAGERDRERAGERREQADPGAGDGHPRSALAWSTSRTMRRRAIATIRPSPIGDLGGGDGHDGEREDLAVEVAELAGERDQGEVRRVQHDLEREQDDQRAPPQHHSERSDPEQERRDDQVPADIRPVHQARSSPCRLRLSSSGVVPSTTPPTAATSSTIEVISNASRWSVRKSSPISAGLPKVSETSRRVAQVVAPREAEHDDDLDQQRRRRDDRRRAQERRPSRPGCVGATAEVRDDEEEHDHDRARRRRAPAPRRGTRPTAAGRGRRARRGSR